MRREKGTGSIFYSEKRKRWVACVNVGYTSKGTRKFKRMYCKTEQEAKKWLREYKNNIAKQQPGELAKLSLESYMRNQWLEKAKKKSMKPSSYDRLERTCEHQIFPVIGDIQMCGITVNDIQTLLNDMPPKYSQSVIKKTYDALNACFDFAVKNDVIMKNPVGSVTVPKSERITKEIEILSDEDKQAIKEECIKPFKRGVSGYRLGYAFILLLNTGMREGEICALEWADVNFEKLIIRINKTVSEVKIRDDSADAKYKTIVYNEPKTKSSRRSIPINKAALDALQHLHEITGSFKYVLSTANGTMVKPRKLANTFKTIQKNCGFEKTYGIHALRHTFASNLFNKGTDVKIVSKLLGHSSTSITCNIYIHVIEDVKAQAVALIDEV